MKGVYILKLNLKKNQEIMVGKLGKKMFEKGSYYYVGSSQNNIEKRIQRHFSKEKKLHWHIDYLTTHPLFEVLSVEKLINTSKEKECQTAKELLKKYEPIKGFGCSDCKCQSHLFYHKE
ncbi:MAG: GIY-YIG nuclease family protein [Candidatus Nanoarchaeia archaeon]|jgi:Uri superfamily endonuclease